MIVPEAYHPGHAMGESEFVVVNPSVDHIEGLLYVNIPKNASCWVKYHLSQCPSTFYNYYNQGFDPNKHLALVVLRDPVERWISGMGQILIGYAPGHRLHVDSIDWDQITTVLIRNNHVQPQHEFFANIPHNCIVWFRCDNDLQQTFSAFLKTYNLNINWLPKEQDTNNFFNITKKIKEQTINNLPRPPQQQIVEKIRLVLDTHPKYIDRLTNLYKEDYKLYHEVSYYKPK